MVAYGDGSFPLSMKGMDGGGSAHKISADDTSLQEGAHRPYERVPYHEGLPFVPLPGRKDGSAARQRDFGRQERRGAAEADSRAIAVRLLPTVNCGRGSDEAASLNIGRSVLREPFPYREGGGLPVSLETTRAECTVECSSLPRCYGCPTFQYGTSG